MRVGSGVRAIPSGSLVADAVDEVEDVLTVHPEVAVVGEPDEEMGQQVVAVVEPAHPERAGTALGAEPQAWCRGHLAGIRCPRQVRFVDRLPRLPAGSWPSTVSTPSARRRSTGTTAERRSAPERHRGRRRPIWWCLELVLARKVVHG